MTTQEEIAAVERSIKESKADIELGSAYERLCKNKDFLAVIKQAYFKDEAVRLVHLRGDPSFQTPEKQEAILKQMDSVANLNQFFLALAMKARLSEKSLKDNEEFLEDAAKEGTI